jgi:hypothetical protein
MSLRPIIRRKQVKNLISPVLVPSWRRKLKRIRNFIELKESITCPDCWSENIVIDDIDETL